jgi:YHS domain-containing protein
MMVGRPVASPVPASSLQPKHATHMKFLTALLASLLFAGAAAAELNKKCPVSGEDVDAAVTSEVKVTIGFCCSKCQSKFEGDPKQQQAAVKKYAGSTESPANKKCPVANKDLADGNTTTASMTVGLCCKKCKTTFEADPKKYISKVK